MLFIESTTSDWQSRVSAGKIVGKFKSRVQSLLKYVETKFYFQTDGSLVAKDRIERGRQLVESVQIAATNSFNHQLSILQNQFSNKLRKSLMAILATTDGEAVGLEASQQAMRQALFEFRNAASEIEVEEFGLSAESFQTELSTSLQAILAEFPESNIAKLEGLKKLDGKVAKPPKKKGSRAVNVGLSLVGMLRPPGYGNLQGYASYATSLLGLPLDLLMGVQNDGDSPEVCFHPLAPLYIRNIELILC